MAEDTNEAAVQADAAVCEVCGKAFPSAWGMRVHAARVHSSRVGPRKAGRASADTGRAARSTPKGRRVLDGIFEDVLSGLREQAEFVEACLGAIEKLLEEDKKLRLKFIQRSDQIKRLLAERGRLPRDGE